MSVYDKLNKTASFFDEEVLQAKYIQNITQTQDGKLWLGTFNNGLIKFDLNQKKTKQYIRNPEDKNTLSFNDVRDVIEDEQNNLWIATWGGGLNYLNTQTQEFKQYDIQNNNLISLLKEGNSLWITSYGGGLSHFNTETKEVKSFVYDENDENTVSSNNLFSLLKDSHGYLWVGTSGEGINRMNLETQHIERFNTNENIRYKNISSILEDDEGNIWFGTKDGIIKYDYEEENFNTFSSLSGDFHINSAFKDDAGFLYFGGIKGVLKFTPAQLNTYTHQPDVAITNLKIFNKDIEFEKSAILPEESSSSYKITLEHFQDVITFEFAALKFPFSNNCEYAI
jgi:ligand-binding sensor domain-containing protein